MKFNGCTITPQENGDIEMDMKEYLGNVNMLDLDRGRRKELGDKATTGE